MRSKFYNVFLLFVCWFVYFNFNQKESYRIMVQSQILQFFSFMKEEAFCSNTGQNHSTAYKCIWIWCKIWKPYLLEVVCHLKLILLLSNFSLDFRVRVVNDGQEHVKQHKKDEEHIEDEVDRTQDSVCLFKFMEVEIAKDDTKQSEPGENLVKWLNG